MDLKRTSLRSVAIFEAAKGLLVLATAFALFRHLHTDWQAAAEQLVAHFHLNPARKYPQILLALSANITEPRLLALAFGALFYVAIRFVEACGLWRNRSWAAILGIASAGLYIPFEIIELEQRVTWTSLLMLVFNILVVAVLWFARPKAASS